MEVLWQLYKISSLAAISEDSLQKRIISRRVVLCLSVARRTILHCIAHVYRLLALSLRAES
jgi:hypothetical protein